LQTIDDTLKLLATNIGVGIECCIELVKLCHWRANPTDEKRYVNWRSMNVGEHWTLLIAGERLIASWYAISKKPSGAH
jgi:hypothetical protein